MSHLATAEKDSCLAKYRKTLMLESEMCNRCVERKDLTGKVVASRNTAMVGICILLHGSEGEKESLCQRNVSREAVERVNRRSRSSRAKRTPYVAKPAANDSKHNNERVDSTLVAVQAIKNVNMNDPKVQRAILRKLVGRGANLTLSRGGASKSATNKASATAGDAANVLAEMLAKNDPSQADSIRQNLSTNATKRARLTSQTSRPVVGTVVNETSDK